MDKRKEEIVEVALKRFCHYGFSKTTMNEIAEDLHISKANLYYYYQDKPALIKDVISSVTSRLNEQEDALLKAYNKNFIETLFKWAELRACYLKKYYVLNINESLEWIKGLELTDFLTELYEKDVVKMKNFFRKAVETNDVRLSNIEEAAASFIEASRAIGVIHKFHDIITGIPNRDNIDIALESQKRLIRLIFEDKIVIN